MESVTCGERTEELTRIVGLTVAALVRVKAESKRPKAMINTGTILVDRPATLTINPRLGAQSSGKVFPPHEDGHARPLCACDTKGNEYHGPSLVLLASVRQARPLERAETGCFDDFETRSCLVID